MTQYDQEPDETDVQNDAIVGTAFKWSLAVFLAIAILVIPLIYFLNRPAVIDDTQKSELAEVQVREISTVTAPAVTFTDITAESGIDFVHESSARGQKLLPETMGGGCAFFDFDNDGDQDLLFVNSQTWEEFTGEAVESPSLLALYENDGTGNFKNVTADSGLDISLYGMGVACGDYDSDGLVDLYVSAVGTNRLFHNEGDGKFKDVTEPSGTGGDASEWGTSCGWFDFDHDNDLDLFVCNYVKWSKEFDSAQDFKLTGGDRAYGRPQNFEGAFPYLFRNDGDGQFTEVAEQAGLQIKNPDSGVAMAKSLGVTFDDFNRDGWLDMLVANDTVQNFLFQNEQDGTFNEVGMIAGVAFDMNGAARGAMGIDSADFRNNDSIGVAIGNFSNEMTALYVAAQQSALFIDEAISSGLGPTTRLSLTFGVFFFDYDLDGRLDLFASNGHLEEDINRVQPSQFYEQPPQLFWNCGVQADTEFLLVPKDVAGQEFSKPLVGRGSSYADIDGDGDLDIVIATTGQKPRLLRNDLDSTPHWVRVKLKNDSAQVIGALVELTANGKSARRRVSPTRSYLSQSELPLTFGLEDSTNIEKLRVVWTDGTETVITDHPVDQTIIVEAQTE